MTDEVTITSEDGTDLEDQAAHDAAVALGAAEVHEEAAEDAAGDAQASAEMAAMAAQAAGEGVAEAVEAASTAEAAAGVGRWPWTACRPQSRPRRPRSVCWRKN